MEVVDSVSRNAPACTGSRSCQIYDWIEIQKSAKDL